MAMCGINFQIHLPLEEKSSSERLLILLNATKNRIELSCPKSTNLDAVKRQDNTKLYQYSRLTIRNSFTPVFPEPDSLQLSV